MQRRDINTALYNVSDSLFVEFLLLVVCLGDGMFSTTTKKDNEKYLKPGMKISQWKSCQKVPFSGKELMRASRSC